MSFKYIGILWAAAAVQAQPAPEKFEVASIKPAGPQSVRGREGGPGTKDPTHFRFQSATVEDLIVIGYHVDYFQVTSKVPIDREHYDVSANVPENATREQFRLMMRNLLEERFHLKAKVESREFAGYELVVAKTGLKLKESSSAAAPTHESRRPADDGFPDLPPGRPGLISNHTMSGGFVLVRTRARQEPISILAQSLHAPGEAPVVDRTGLTGKYDFTLEYTTDVPGSAHDGDSATPVAPSVFTALQQQLGLQLVAKKLPFDVVVVEAVDRAASEN